MCVGVYGCVCGGIIVCCKSIDFLNAYVLYLSITIYDGWCNELFTPLVFFFPHIRRNGEVCLCKCVVCTRCFLIFLPLCSFIMFLRGAQSSQGASFHSFQIQCNQSSCCGSQGSLVILYLIHLCDLHALHPL